MNRDIPLIEDLVGQIRGVVDPVFGDRPAVALLDFPNHSNVGDAAIWLGELAYFRTLSGARIRYTCDYKTYDPEALRRLMPVGTIVLHGGGNLGDLWPHLQHFREKVIQDFPDYPIIQFPQTIFFQDAAGLDCFGELARSHSDFVLLVRDARSYQTGHEYLGMRTIRCPDMAFCMGALSRPVEPSKEVVWLWRTDKEAPDTNPARGSRLLDVLPEDWLQESTSLSMRLRNLLARHVGSSVLIPRIIASLDSRIAAHRVARGAAQLSRGKVLVTNRLHGHILAVLLGIPHVLLDNSYGKNRSYYSQWTKRSRNAHWARSLQEASAIAESLRSEGEAGAAGSV